MEPERELHFVQEVLPLIQKQTCY